METKQKKIGKCIESVHNKFRFEYGTVNYKVCKAAFISVTTYVMPEENYESDVTLFKKRYKCFTNQLMEKYFQGQKVDVIRLCEASDGNMKNMNNRFTFMNIELNLNFNRVVEYGDIKDKLDMIGKDVIDYISSYSDGLVFSDVRIK